jgi:ribose transport system substrate-binding protein
MNQERRALCRAGAAAFATLAAGPATRLARATPASPASVSAPAAAWQGPPPGPRAVGPRRIGVLAEDLRNGGVLGVAQGLREAGRELGWSLHVIDAGGSAEGRDRALRQALQAGVDGIALCGSAATDLDQAWDAQHAPALPAAGWHVAAAPGPLPQSHIGTNVSTDPLQVGRIAAAAVAPRPGERTGAVIFTDSRFAIATTKTQAMLRELAALPGTTVLEVLDVPISDSAHQMPELVRRLVRVHGERWTHALAINDIYFDHAVPVLIALHPAADALRLISAGDGSASAFVRIRSGTYQVATVAEPLNLQGWQLADELNRAFAGRPPSGYVTPAQLVTRLSLAVDRSGSLVYDPPYRYREAYRAIWFAPEGG